MPWIFISLRQLPEAWFRLRVLKAGNEKICICRQTVYLTIVGGRSKCKTSNILNIKKYQEHFQYFDHGAINYYQHSPTEFDNDNLMIL